MVVRGTPLFRPGGRIARVAALSLAAAEEDVKMILQSMLNQLYGPYEKWSVALDNKADEPPHLHPKPHSQLF